MKHSVRVSVMASVTGAYCLFACNVSWALKTSDGVTLLKQPRTFPIVISAPGSYRLKMNLTVLDANTTAIKVTASDVTIDLNGFAIHGPTVCSGGPPVAGCTPTGAGVGIDATAAGIVNTTVTNGTVRGMGYTGIEVNDGRVRNVGAYSNGCDGIDATTVADSIASSNGCTGIVAGVASSTGVVVNTATYGNNFAGIQANTVANSTADAGAYGIIATTVTGSVADNNYRDGIDATTVANSVADYNGTGIASNEGANTVTGSEASSNGADGIDATTVANSLADFNGGYGINDSNSPSSPVDDPNTVTGSEASSNGADGIGATVVANSTASANTAGGIGPGEYFHSSNTVTGCAADFNGADGIDATVVANSTASANTAGGINSHGIVATLVTSCEADNNSSDGISAQTMIGNDAHSNGRWGLWGGNFSPNSGYENNVANTNTLGNAGEATNMGENVCNGGTCP